MPMFQTLPVSSLVRHASVRVGMDPETNESDAHLVQSIQLLGVLTPLVVAERADGGFVVVDGYRRFLVATGIGTGVVPCMVNAPVTETEFHRLRAELHATLKPLTPTERIAAGKRALKNWPRSRT